MAYLPISLILFFWLKFFNLSNKSINHLTSTLWPKFINQSAVFANYLNSDFWYEFINLNVVFINKPNSVFKFRFIKVSKSPIILHLLFDLSSSIKVFAFTNQTITSLSPNFINQLRILQLLSLNFSK